MKMHLWLTPILLIVLIFMLVDVYAPGLRVPLQALCGAIIGIPIAIYIISKMDLKA